MGYAFVVSPCVFCKSIFSYNPLRVPSIKVNDVREPICRGCHARAQATRKAHGLEPWPEPFPDAYEACDEAELGYD